MFAFCTVHDWCTRDNGHAGAHTTHPTWSTLAFDTHAQLTRERHERAAVLGRRDGNTVSAAVMPEYLPDRFKEAA
jgi:hypothetical protein